MKALNVYRNLRLLPGCGWSIQQNGRVIAHVTGGLILYRVQMKHATPAQLARVQENCREVCQWLKAKTVGAIADGQSEPTPGSGWLRLYADPKRGPIADASGVVDSSPAVWLAPSGAAYHHPEPINWQSWLHTDAPMWTAADTYPPLNPSRKQ